MRKASESRSKDEYWSKRAFSDFIQRDTLMSSVLCRGSRTMQVRHMEAFLALAQVLNYRRAAEMVHLSQPALSEQIRELERDLGACLFKRDRSGTVLTPQGAELVPLVRRALEDVSAVRAAVQKHPSKSRRHLLTIGVMAGGVGPRTWPLFAEFHRRCPDVELRICQVGFADALPALAERHIDVLAATGPFGEADGLVTTVGRVSVGAIMAAHIPQACDESVDVDWVAARAVLRPPPGMGDTFDAFWMMRSRTVRRSRQVVVAEADIGIMLRMVATGVVGLWPTLVPSGPGTVVRPLTEPLWAPLQLVSRRRASSQAALMTHLASELAGSSAPEVGVAVTGDDEAVGRDAPRDGDPVERHDIPVSR